MSRFDSRRTSAGMADLHALAKLDLSKAEREKIAPPQRNGHADQKGNVPAELQELSSRTSTTSANVRNAVSRTANTSTSSSTTASVSSTASVNTSQSRTANVQENNRPSRTAAASEPRLETADWEAIGRLVQNGHVDSKGNQSEALQRLVAERQALSTSQSNRSSTQSIPTPLDVAKGATEFHRDSLRAVHDFHMDAAEATFEFHKDVFDFSLDVAKWGMEAHGYVDPVAGLIYDSLFGHEKTEGSKMRISGERFFNHNPTFNRLQYGDDKLGDITHKHYQPEKAEASKAAVGEDVTNLIRNFADEFARGFYGPGKEYMGEQWGNILTNLFARSPLRGPELYDYVQANLQSAAAEIAAGQKL